MQTFIRDHVHVAKRINPNHTELYLLSPRVIPFTERWRNQRVPTLDPDLTTRVPYYSVPRQRTPNLVARKIARQLIPTLPPPDETLLHIHWLYPAGMAIPALAEAGYRVILMIHGSDWYKVIRKPWFEPVIGPVLDAADQICVSGDDLKADILKRYPKLDIRVMYNYIDTSLFKPSCARDQAAAQEKLGWDPGTKHVLTVANVRHEKGVDRLLRAAHGVYNAHGDYNAHGVYNAHGRHNAHDGVYNDHGDYGDYNAHGVYTPEKKPPHASAASNIRVHYHLIGQPAKGSYKQQVRELAHKLGDCVTLHPPVPREELALYYRASDLYVIPSRSEGFNVSLLEAASTGLPVIATNTGGAATILKSCEGLLIGNGDGTEDGEYRVVTNLQNSLKNWLGKDLRRDETVSASSAFVQKHYSFETYEQRLRELYGFPALG